MDDILDAPTLSVAPKNHSMERSILDKPSIPSPNDTTEKNAHDMYEKRASLEETRESYGDGPYNEQPPKERNERFFQGWSKRLNRYGIEERGIRPAPAEERIDTQFSKIFFVFFSTNFNILSFSAGTLGPVVFGLGLRDSCLVILFFNLLCCIPPAYFTTWGPKLGMRQMVQSRYSFGYYGVILPCVLNLIGMFGFCVLNCILGGQTLSSVANGHLSWTLGIVIIAIISLLVCFCGYKVLNWFERVAWFPTLVTFVVALGVGGKHLSNPPPAMPATASSILTFASTIAGFVITYSPLSSDFTLYFEPKASSHIVFWYSYLGLLVPITTIQCFGAAAAIAASSVPAWNAGYANGNVGGLLEAMLQPVGNFGKFLTVLLSFSVMGNIAMTLYSMGFNLQLVVPQLGGLPRYLFSVVSIAIVLPLSIVGSHRFYDTLTDFLGLIGYWASTFVAVLLVEHHVFRKGDFTTYDRAVWNVPSRLPWGIAAVGAIICSFGVIVPSMNQAWFVGPIAKTTGDIGFEVGFCTSLILYLVFRTAEKKLQKLS